MAKSNKTWKSVEMRIARFFGAERNPCSGSFAFGTHNNEFTKSDSNHKKLYIETKHFTKAFIFSLMKQTIERAVAENKIPVVCMHEKGTEGFLIICRSEDLQKIAKEEACHLI